MLAPMDNLRRIFTLYRQNKTLIAAFALIAIILYTQSLKNSDTEKKGKSLSAQDQKVTDTPTPTDTIAPTTVPFFTSTPRIQQPLPTVSQQIKNENLLDYFYPGARQVRQDTDKLVLVSSDDPNIITDWYKKKINSLGMKAKTFVTTNTNGSVENKLVASDRKTEISVEIKKKSNEKDAQITLTINSSVTRQ